MKKAKRMERFSSGIFSEMEEAKKKVESRGIKVINLGVGSPDLPPAPHIIEALRRSVEKPENYSYPVTALKRLYEAVAGWYKRRFNVDLDPANEVLVLMGSQDGLAHLAMAYVDPGDIALVPDPGYPIYSFSILMAQGEIFPMPLLAEKRFLPDFKEIPEDVAKKAKLMWLNYPNNPVAAMADRKFFEQAVEFARHYDILICHDVAYAELAYDGYKPVSFLEVPGAKEVGIEFYSLSKTYNMAGCRIGFAVGNSDVLSSLATIKSNIDYGVFYAVQEAGIAALTGPQEYVAETSRTYQRRRDVLIEGLKELGWEIPKPSASMFVWAPLPPGYSSSMAFARELLEKAGVIVTPGVAFGSRGEGYVRIALVRDESTLGEVVQRIGRSFVFR
ncbi:MAG: LL-diaminopimelate aminotransferase [Pelotomaculum sp.]|uniref:Aminotransferase n=1 Tax=Pelotomaculum thermopropionicum (strain DSM 13744 / JCM 10971 / SI) TaxID=370438 RepID=A5D2P1_PELTS|nr:LL-diaminopimelate aminotransferase [Pelotomaculum sp.]BAF59489.1 aspartate/tyrosine/aromatic aminotransferase [Pelotomaculum thermopropionicum SI]